MSEFAYGDKPNVPDFMIRGGVKYKIVTDHLGSVVAVVHSTTGAVTQAISYDEFGRVLSDTNPGFQPFGFAGGLYDPDTGLVRFGARDYNPETGRWMQKDPILFAGGDTNLYGYVLNDPVNFIDPMGLEIPGPRNPPSFPEGTEDFIDKYIRCTGQCQIDIQWGPVHRTIRDSIPPQAPPQPRGPKPAGNDTQPPKQNRPRDTFRDNCRTA